MQTTDDSGFIIGTYIREIKNRFLCEVSIANETVVCYVPSSCHLSNFLQLEGKNVLLVPTKTANSRTAFALFAVPFKRSYIILNTAMANRAMEYSIHGRRFSFLGKRQVVVKEHIVEGYKSDLFLPASNTLIEIKSVISPSNRSNFPTVYSERTIKQLRAIHSMLIKGYKVCFAIVSMNPYVKNIQIDNNTVFYSELNKCLEVGLVLKAYTCRLQNDKVKIDREISVNYSVLYFV